MIGKWVVEGRFMIIDDDKILGKKIDFQWQTVAGPYFLPFRARMIQKRYTKFANGTLEDDEDNYGLLTREYRVTKIWGKGLECSERLPKSWG